MAKPKKSSGTASARKNHGPKRHLFRELKPMVATFAKLGLLSKYDTEDSFMLAVAARGKKASHSDWESFKALPNDQKKAYFAKLKK